MGAPVKFLPSKSRDPQREKTVQGAIDPFRPVSGFSKKAYLEMGVLHEAAEKEGAYPMAVKERERKRFTSSLYRKPWLNPLARAFLIFIRQESGVSLELHVVHVAGGS